MESEEELRETDILGSLMSGKSRPKPGTNLRAEPILDFWGPYAKLCRPGGGQVVMSGYTHLFVFHSVSNRARGKHSRNSFSSAARYVFNSLF